MRRARGRISIEGHRQTRWRGQLLISFSLAAIVAISAVRVWRETTTGTTTTSIILRHDEEARRREGVLGLTCISRGRLAGGNLSSGGTLPEDREERR
jgi:hypothetical protein